MVVLKPKGLKSVGGYVVARFGSLLFNTFHSPLSLCLLWVIGIFSFGLFVLTFIYVSYGILRWVLKLTFER